ncbi:hypothetical protein V5799_017119 [Amblyomma americanum]|uniref:Endonuclease/exonuclease/phosphatase domain-containing protein n=1 Tax=Amblyomma americanum TaxID=6943 RepID=A0AAQ4F305_AMBAM
MPLEESKIVVRPRGGLDIVKTGTTTVAVAILAAAKITSEESAADTIGPKAQQNIMVVSTPNEDNAASNSSQRKKRFKTILHGASTAAGRNTLIVCGDFNAMNPAWGYKKYTAKGRDLYQDAMELDFTLITDPTHPTRFGYSVFRDTTPGLTFVKNDVRGAITWRNTGTDLGSDHTIVGISIPEHNDTSIKTHRWIDWDAFRDARRQTLTTISMT